MKKTHITSLLILFLVFSALPAFATSGACSYHGGVNCYAGPAIQGGYAICSDGTESSVLYGDMVECQSYFCTSQAQVTAYQAQLGQTQISSYETGSYRSSSGNSLVSTYQKVLSQCEDQYQDYQSYIRNGVPSGESPTGPVIYRGCQANAHFSGDECVCDDGWIMTSRNRCIPDDATSAPEPIEEPPVATPVTAQPIVATPPKEATVTEPAPKAAPDTTTFRVATRAPQVIVAASTTVPTPISKKAKGWWGRITSFFVNIF